MTEAEQIQALQQALAVHQQGRAADAEAVYRRVLQVNPLQPTALHLLGLICLQTGRAPEAWPLLQAATERMPGDATVWNSAGEALRALGRAPEAETHFRRAIALAPQAAPFHSNLGAALLAQERWSEAEAAFRTAIEHDATFTKGWFNLANTLRLRSRFADAEAALARTLELAPGMAEAWNMLGGIRRTQKRLPEAEACYRRALALKPGLPEAATNLGSCLKSGGQLTEAEAVYRAGLAASPRAADLYRGLGSVLRERGDFPGALAAYEQALALAPKHALTLSSLLFLEGAAAARPDPAHLARARRWADLHRPPRLIEGKVPPVEPGRRLRIGYLSSDFQKHAAAFFIGPLLAAHDPARVEVFTYASVPAPDDTTAQLQEKGAQWHSVAELTDAEAARLIHRHGIDVLIDLNGHTSGSRTRILAHRPAPVQALYLGYFATSGLDTVDYWITDEVLHPIAPPEATSDAAFVERLWRLPRCWLAYAPSPESPDVAVPPERYEADGAEAGLSSADHARGAEAGADGGPPPEPRNATTAAPAGDGRERPSEGPPLARPEPTAKGGAPGRAEAAGSGARLRCESTAEAGVPRRDQAMVGEAARRLRSGLRRLTFGSTHQLAKLSPETLDLWAAVLRAVPEADLVLKTRNLGDPGVQQGLRAALATRGVAPERLRFGGHTRGLANHLAFYSTIDLALDSHPYSGATTTCDTLWMGVPVVTLAGRMMASRMTASILAGVGLTDWITTTPEAYVATVRRLASELLQQDPPQALAARRALRERFARSPLLDARSLAAALEDAYARMRAAAV